MPGAPLFIVLNKGSGSDDATEVRRTIEGVLREAGRPFELLLADGGKALNRCADDAVLRASRRGGVVVAAGGDGTINTVAQAVLRSGCPFGVLPQGTFNYFSRLHGIPADTAQATRLLLEGHVEPVQVGLVNERVFLVNASVGLYPQLLEDREAFKARYGRSRVAALFAALQTLLGAHRSLRLHVSARGQDRDLRTLTLFVGNNALQLEQVGLPQAQALSQGQLAAVVLKPVGRLALLWLLLRGAFGRLGEADAVSSFAFRRLVARPPLLARRRIKVATDGEVNWMQTPLEFSISPQPLRLLKPRPSAPGGDMDAGAQGASP